MASKTQNEDLARFLYIKLKKLVDFKTFSLGKIEGTTINYLFYVEEDEIFEGLSKEIDPEKSLAYYAISHKEVLIINDFDKEVFTYIKDFSSTGNENIKYNSILVQPFEINGETKGFFSVQDRKKNFFNAEKSYFLEKQLNIFLFCMIEWKILINLQILIILLSYCLIHLKIQLRLL